MTKKIISLNQHWQYTENFKEEYISPTFKGQEFKLVNLPHTNKEIPYNYFDEKMYQFVSCYRKAITIPKIDKGQCIFIDFEGVMTYAEVYFNGEMVGTHKGGYTPFSIDITHLVNFEVENELVVKVDSTERADIPPFGYVIDYLTYGGIYREVNLRVENQIFIENIFARPKDVLIEKKKVETTVYIVNTTGKEEKVQLSAILKFGEKEIAQNSKTINVSATRKSEVEIEIENLEGILLWDIENPNLYELEIVMSTENNKIATYKTKIGFREAEVTKNGFYLNGNKIKLRGLNRHQSFPYVGYAMPERIQRKDADLLKNELSVNVVRTSHYPQSRHFLDRCDEIGLLVLEEIPGWQHIGDESWKKVAMENEKEMIERDWNHPSIFCWGVRINESQDDHDFYKETNRIAHELDFTRQTCGIRHFSNSEFLEDVYTRNDFNHKGEELVLLEQKKATGLIENVPYMVTEFCGHIYPTKRFDQEERLMEHSLRHLRVQNAAALNDSISGAIGWCAFDYNTHYDFGSGDRICYHGVMDMFRIPKLAANFYKSQVKPKKEVVLEPTTLWSRGERNIGGIVPLVIYTNCEYVELYLEGKLQGTYYPDKETYAGVEYPPIVIKEMTGEWGSRFQDGTFKGYVEGKNVIERSYCKNPVAKALEGKADDLTLLGDGIDTTRIVYKLVDQVGNILPYCNEFIKFSITGPGEIIGPKETALIGGCIAVWVKTKEEQGDIELTATCSRFAAEGIKIKVN